MAISTIFINNRTQAVRLPSELRLPESVKQVQVRAVGNERIVPPGESSWGSFLSTVRKSAKISCRSAPARRNASARPSDDPLPARHEHRHLRDQAPPTRSAALHIQGRTALWIHPCRVEDTRAVHRSQRPTHCSPCAQRRACDSDEQPQKIRTRTRPADRKLDRATVLIIFSFITLMSKLCDPQILLSPCSCRPSRTDQARIHSPSLQSIGQLRR